METPVDTGSNEPIDIDPDPIAPPPQYADNAADNGQSQPPSEGNPPPAENAPTEFDIEAYLAGVKVDEGQTYEFDQALLKDIAPLANAEGVKAETLGKLANFLAARQSADIAKAAEERAAYNERQAAYIKQLDAEAEALRAENPQFDANVRAALNLPFLKGSEFLEVLNKTHLIHDPKVLQVLERAGRTVSSDEGVGVNNTVARGGQTNRSFASIITDGLIK